MDDLAAQCKKQLETFRIKELKDVLSHIGFGKQGKKQVLVDKIMTIVLAAERRQPSSKGSKPDILSRRHGPSHEDLAKVIDDIYRMRYVGAADLATTAGSGPPGSMERDEVVSRVEAKTRCPCGKAIDCGSTIQCEDQDCMVQQHFDCVVIPDKDATKGEIPSEFYCEICRIQYGDPFCVSVSHPLQPSKTKMTLIFPLEVPTTMHNLDASFVLNYHDLELLSRPNYELQVWCVLLSDKVAFRMHWPQKAELQVNGFCVRVTNRPGQQLLGINGRDDGPVISEIAKHGRNQISFSAYDGRSFCIGVRILHRRTIQQVLDLIPGELEGESFDTALSRVRSCIGGGHVSGDDSDSDLQVVSEWVTVNFRCPMSGSRIQIAGRFSPCTHIGCFDLHTFVELNQRARKWQCPICLKNYSLRNLIIDPFFSRVAEVLKGYGEGVTEIELKPDCSWRPKLEGEAKLREAWRLPDGSIRGENMPKDHHEGLLCPVKIENAVASERLPPKEESERVPLKIGLKRKPDGTWQVNTDKPLPIFGSNQLLTPNRLTPNRVLSASSSGDASREDSSVNQESNLVNWSVRDDMETVSKSTTQAAGHSKNADCLLKSSEIIVLSDTDEEDMNNGSLGGCENQISLQSFQPLPEVEVASLNCESQPCQSLPDTCCPLPEVGPSSRSGMGSLDLFGGRGEDMDISFWQMEGGHNAPYEFLGSASENTSWPSRNGQCTMDATSGQAVPGMIYNEMESQENWGSGMIESFPEVQLSDPSLHNEMESQENWGSGMIENFPEVQLSDPSLHIFLPQQPARLLAQVRPQKTCIDSSSEGFQEPWISLSLGGCGAAPISSCPPSYEAEQPWQTNTGPDNVADSASALLDLSNHGARAPVVHENPIQRRPRGIAAHRSAHCPRHYFQID